MASSDDEGGSDGSNSPTALVGKLLGIRTSSLRFRHHGLKQKPHLILRRVEDDLDDLTDDGGLKHGHHVVRFSLFAMKRIDVKPGKELLLCVATEEEAFKDTPLVFEAEDAVIGADKNPKDAIGDVVQQREVVTTPLEQVVPPKMRRTWTKKTEVSPPGSGPTLTHVSVGVQAALRETSSKGVEARPEQRSVSVQAKVFAVSTSVQAVVAPPSADVFQQNVRVCESPLTTPPTSTSLPPSLELLQETPSTEYTDLPEEPGYPLTRRSKRKQRDVDRKNAKRRRLRAEKRDALAQLEASQPDGERGGQDKGELGLEEAKDEYIKADPGAGAGTVVAPLEISKGPSMSALTGLMSQEGFGKLVGDEEVAMVPTDVHAPEPQVNNKRSPQGHVDSDGSLSPMELDSPSVSALSSPATSYFPASLPTTQSSLSTGSASPTLTSKGGPLRLLLGSSRSIQPSPTAQPDGDLSMLSPLTPLPSLDDSDSSSSLQVPSSGLVPASNPFSTPPESPGYTPSALVLPDLPDVPAAQRVPHSTIQSRTCRGTSPSERKVRDKQREPQEPVPLPPNVERGAIVGQTSAALIRLIINAKLPGAFDPAALTSSSGHSAPPPFATMYNPGTAEGSLAACQGTEEVSQRPVAPSAAQQLPKESLSQNTPGWQAISGISGPRTPPCSSVPPLGSSTGKGSGELPTIPTGPRSLARAKEVPSFPPALVFDSRQTTQSVQGSLSNPLNIAPSRMPASMRKAMSGAIPPTGPRSLQLSSSRKPVVIGMGWSAGKGGVTQVLSTHAAEKKKVMVKAGGARVDAQRPAVPTNRKVHDVLFDPSTPPPPSESPPPPPPPADTPPTSPFPSHPPPVSAPQQPSKWEPVGAPKNAPPQEIAKASNETESHPATPFSTVWPKPCVPSSSRLGVYTKALPSSPTRPTESPSPDFSKALCTKDSSGVGTSGGARASPTAGKLQTTSASPLAMKKEHTEQPKKVQAPSTVIGGFMSGGLLRSPLADFTQPAVPPPSALSPLVSLSTLPHHPSLPAKPTHVTPQPSSYRGVKRDRPLSPETSDHPPQSSSSSSRCQRDRASSPPRRKTRPNIKCPTIKSSATKRLQGDGEPYMQTVSFSSDGLHFVLGCSDKTVRVWSTQDKIELARLMHHSPIVNVFWLEEDTGVIVLTTDGLVSEWTKTGENAWKWAKILSAGTDSDPDDTLCFAYARDRIAVSFPRAGVKVWIWSKGDWQAQRSILRQNVTAIKFIEGGQALLGGTRDGTLWSCEVPNGTLRAYAFLKNKIISLDLCPLGTHGLVGFSSGGAILVGGLRQAESKGNIESVYSLTRESDGWAGRNEYGASLATQGQAIVFGTVDSCALVWDRKKGNIVYGLEHEEDEVIQVTAAVDNIGGREGCMLTGTRNGYICWWALPVAAGQGEGAQTKKQKVEW